MDVSTRELSTFLPQALSDGAIMSTMTGEPLQQELLSYFAEVRSHLQDITAEIPLSGGTMISSQDACLELWPLDTRELVSSMVASYPIAIRLAEGNILYLGLAPAFGSLSHLRAAEAVAAITSPFNREPKQPNRDHLGHVIAVYWLIDTFLIGSQTTAVTIRDNVLKQLMDNCLLDDLRDALKMRKRHVEIALIRSVPLMALCHDQEYTVEVGKWLASKLKSAWGAVLNRPHPDKLFYLKLMTDAFNRIDSLVPCPPCKLEKWMGKCIDETDQPPNHGQRAAINLLDQYSSPFVWEQLDKFDRFAIFCFILAIFNHDTFTKATPGEVKELWQKDPLGVVLSAADLLSEAPRTHWAIAEPPTAVNDEPWQQKLVLHHALCLSKCSFEFREILLKAKYKGNVSRHPPSPVYRDGNDNYQYMAEKACGTSSDHSKRERLQCFWQLMMGKPDARVEIELDVPEDNRRNV
jgi:hypothetical protein